MNHNNNYRRRVSMERNYKLYVHIAPNGKKYYGITGQEKAELRWLNGKGYSTNQYFTRAINKYSWGNIEHIVIYDDLTEDEAKELEQYMIQWYDTANRDYGYNITLGGESNNGYKHTEETKQKIGEANKGRIHTEQSRKNMSEAHKGENNHNYGKHLSEETKRKISEAQKGEKHHMYGKHLSEETKQRISEANKGEKHHYYGKHLSEEHKQKISEAHKGCNSPRAKNVICITTNRIFGSAREAARYYNTSSHISDCCRGKRNYCGTLSTGEKLIWKYIDIIQL